MNKKGNLFVLGLMFCIMLYLATIVMLEPLRESISTSRTNLECGDPSLTVYEDMTCIVVGSMLFLYAMAGLGVALAAVGIRKIAGGGE